MLENVEVFTQSSICIHGNKKVYFDPYQVPKDFHDADFILITHAHYDHFSVEDILKVKKDDTVFVAPMDVIEKVQTIFSSNQMYAVEPNQTLEIENLSIHTVPAYNVAKTYHPQAASWVGYVIRLDGVTYYDAGDTDALKENESISCDVAFVPIGGTFTMDWQEASQFVNCLHPKMVVPIHYGSIVGSKEDEVHFLKQLDSDIVSVIKL